MDGKKIIVVSILLSSTFAFPNGGPIDACVKSNPNVPNHSGISPQPIETLPFAVEQSSEAYGPRDVIKVKISGLPFKGFFIQARDAKTGDWIGSFDESYASKSYDECSAATHTYNDPKNQIELIWRAPDNRRGGVYFTGTVVENYKTFWSGIVSYPSQY
ncbi:putative defense protein 3 [Artemia franciscana]|uniref:Reelin domain-containing protein n=1 Tax=Artemia franciscana TaxID=6661 RepID=A0AA88H9Q1_ARTSF|nr:hypothetical protein QYM36_018069 [Artemia franciscana]